MKERFVCIHGHFYQPPREDPWTGDMEKEDSAYPFHDWNARITVGCYRCNTEARILDARGRVQRTANNFSRISFDCGATLLSWLQEHAEDVYRAILEADRESGQRCSGHGNALAQTYYHLILPLANRRDQETQVRWGIRDFEFRFGRPPEGLWLPETAVDLQTLDALAEHGIRFTILAPHQAKRVRALGETAWNTVTEESLDPRCAYQIRLPSGRTFSLFFFHGPLSRGVAFQGLLHSGDELLRHLLQALAPEDRQSRLVSMATDGETFGHHHRFGEMALAYALEKIESDHLACLTNYAAFLDAHPPTQEVEIREHSSWSCPHGVERWRSDCGCRVGSEPNWHQAWRAPLRQAFEWLRDEVDPVFEQESDRFLKDPWAARNDYVDLLLDRSPARMAAFLEQHARGALDEPQRRAVMSLLELQRHAMAMWTSCGWFFDELSGLETCLVLKQAGRVVDLAQEALKVDVLPGFLERLEQAKSNLPDYDNGRKVFDRVVRPRMRSSQP